MFLTKPLTGHSIMQTITPARLTATRTLMVGAAACLLLIAGCGDKPKQKLELPPPDVRAAEVIQQKVPIEMTFSGTVKSIKTVDIIPRVSGYIEARYFE